MTILKTTLIGLGMSGLCAIGNGYIWNYEFKEFTVYNPVWWIAVLGSFVIAFIIARKTHRMILWIAVVLTGCLALYLAFGYMLRHLS